MIALVIKPFSLHPALFLVWNVTVSFVDSMPCVTIPNLLGGTFNGRTTGCTEIELGSSVRSRDHGIEFNGFCEEAG
jgi:hypothetical protein